ncbi:MAG: hypothetical protein DBX59_05845 [Bacillota bacterium]|nr:MAG: hypothetical protein DBX59_05845 [Bacillota bacterium]
MNKRDESRRKWLIANVVVTALILLAICLLFGLYIYMLYADVNIDSMIGEEKASAIASMFFFLLIFAFFMMPAFVLFAAAAIIVGIVIFITMIRDLKKPTDKISKKRNYYLTYAVISGFFGLCFLSAALILADLLFAVVPLVFVVSVIVNLGCYFSVGNEAKAVMTNLPQAESGADITQTVSETDAPPVISKENAPPVFEEAAVISFESSAERENESGFAAEHYEKVKKKAVRYAVLLGVDLVLLFGAYGQRVFVLYGVDIHMTIFLIAGAISLFTAYSGYVGFLGLQTAYRRRWSYYVAAGLWFIYAVLLLVQAFRAEFAFNLLFAAFGALFALTGVAALKLASIVKTEYERNKR